MKWSEMNLWTKICLGLVFFQVAMLILVIVIQSEYWWVNAIALPINIAAFFWALNTNKKINAYNKRTKTHRLLFGQDPTP